MKRGWGKTAYNIRAYDMCVGQPTLTGEFSVDLTARRWEREYHIEPTEVTSNTRFLFSHEDRILSQLMRMYACDKWRFVRERNASPQISQTCT